MQHPVNADLLLEHLDWMRRLAHDLTRDPDLGEEVAQSAWVRALERAPKVRNARSWLRQVVLNAWRQNLRERMRRRRREELAARVDRDDLTPSAVYERARAQRMVVDATLKLSEPYRTAILLRYFEDMTPTEIARRLELPLATVKSQLRRGRVILRGELERTHGRESLALVACIPAISRSPWIGTLLMKKIALSAGAAAVLLGGWLWFGGDAETPPEEETVSIGRTERAPVPGAGTGGSSAPLARSSLGSAASGDVAMTEREPTLMPGEFQGRVLWIDASPAVGVQVRIGAHGGTVATDVAGVFRAAVPSGSRTLLVEGRDLMTVVPGMIQPMVAERRGEPVVVIAKQDDVTVHVLDVDSRAIAGAEVQFDPPSDFRQRFDEVVDFKQAAPWAKLDTDAEGTADISFPQISGATLRVRKVGFPTHRIALSEGQRDYWVTLRKPTLVEGQLLGQVLDAELLPLPGAMVTLGTGVGTVTDESGMFAVAHSDTRYNIVRAIKAGHTPAELELPEDPGFIVLQLGPPPKSVTGRVVDTGGMPLSGMWVWPREQSAFRAVDGFITTAESFLSNSDDALWPRVMTDDDGGFRVDGLIADSYQISIVDPDTMARYDHPVTAGLEDIEIVFPDGLWFAEVRGIAVDGWGNPVPGVWVSVGRTVVGMSFDGLGYDSRGTGIPGGTITDAEGRFSLRDVPRDGVYLSYGGQGLMDDYLGYDEKSFLAAAGGRAPTDLRLVVHRLAQVRVDLDHPEEATAMSLLGSDGEPVRMIHHRNNRSQAFNRRCTITNGKSVLYTAPDGVTEVVLYRGNEIVRREPITLSVREVNVIR